MSSAQTITIDGDPSDWPAVLEQPAGVLAAVFISDPLNSTTDDQLSSGAKDVNEMDEWTWSYGNTNDKTDIQNAGAAIIDNHLYFFGDRHAANGDANIGFWLFLNGTAPQPDFTFAPNHNNGDLLILSNFLNGGGVPEIKVYEWDNGSVTEITGTTDTRGASVNAMHYNVPIYTDWAFTPKSGTGYETGLFFEGFIDLTDILTESDLCNTTVLFETRNSQSLPAQLGDFAAGSFNLQPAPPVTQGAEICEPGGEVSLQATAEMGTTIRWYSDEMLQNLVFTGGNYVVNVSMTTTFWVTATNEVGCVSDPSEVVATVNPSPACAITGDDTVCPGGEFTYSAPAWMATYLWSVTGDAAIKEGTPDDEMNVTIVTDQSCGSFTVSLEVTNTYGCESNCNKEVDIVDEENPVADECPAGGDLGCNPEPLLYAAGEGPEWTDNCGIAESGVRAGEPVADEEGCGFSITHVYYAIDYCENEETCEQVFTWKVDLTDPVITTATEDDDLGCNPPVEDIEAALGSATAMDNCDGELEVAAEDSEGAPDGCMMSKTRTFTAIDECGNDASESVTVTWKVDLTDPVIATATEDDDLGCNPPEEDIEAALGSATAMDECDGELEVTVEDSEGTPDGCMMSKTRTFTAVDECGNDASESVTVTWTVDTEGPALECPSDITASCDGNILLDLPPTAWDVCSGEVEVTAERSDGMELDDPFPTGTTTVTLTAEDDCGNPSTCEFTVTIDPCEEFCTYTQGFYGNQKGTACNLEETLRGDVFTEGLLAQGDLIIGANGNTVTFKAGDAALIKSILPGGGSSSVLSGACVPSMGLNCLPLSKQGKLTNQLLAQTIVLGLNLRINSELADLPLADGYLTTQTKLWCEEGSGGLEWVCEPIYDLEWNIVGWNNVDPYEYYMLPEAVLCYMDEMGYPMTVEGLFNLANDALGGLLNPDGVSCSMKVDLSKIASAVDMINNAFDGCRIFVGYKDAKFMCPEDAVEIAQKSAEIEASSLGATDIKAYPNPFNDMVTLEFVAGEDAHAILQINNIVGQTITILMDKQVQKGMLNTVTYQPASAAPGILFYKLTLNGSVQTGKLIYNK